MAGHYHVLAPTNCPTPSGYFVSDDGKIKIPAPCNSWTCPTCGPHKKNKLMDVVRIASDQIKQDKTLPAQRKIWRFLTLTQRDTDPTPIMTAWNRWRAFMAKKKITFDFFLVKEFTKKGKRHLHVLINRYIPSRVVMYAWRLATDGNSYVTKIARREIKNAAGYMTKYMTKTMEDGLFRRRERRYSCSRKYFKEARLAVAFISRHRFRFDYNPHIASVERAFPRARFLPYRIIRWLARGVLEVDKYTGENRYEKLPTWSRGCVTAYC